MSGAVTKSRDNFGQPQSGHRDLMLQHQNVVTDLDTLAIALRRASIDARVAGNISPALAVDANANDIQMGAAISIIWQGMEFPIAIVDPIDTSTLTINNKTIATSKCGAGWVFAKYDGTVDMSQDINAAVYTSAIEALAQYSKPTNTLPPAAGMAPIGCVQVTEGGSGVFTWGPDSITAETKTYYSFRGMPGIISALASFALDAAAATFTYGAGVIRLGTAVVVTLSGKANVAIAGSVIATGTVGAYLVYALADDVEYCLQLGAAYTSLQSAVDAVRDHTRNPLMPVIGVIYIQNASGADFTPGTTAFDKRGITATFTKAQPFGSHVDTTSDLVASKIGNESGVVLTA